MSPRAYAYAFTAIALWGALAVLGVSLNHVPPFFVTGVGLLVGSLIAVPLSGMRWQRWQVPLPTLALGVVGLFGFHFLLFMALRLAPPVQANLINYLWPLGMVVLAPLYLPGMALHRLHVLAALMGFVGAAVAMLARSDGEVSWAWHNGYWLALASAFTWASYSLLTKRVPPFDTAAIGSFALVSGVLSLLCHVVFEPPVQLSGSEWGLLVMLGLGPLGGAFFVWDAALKQGDPRRIGLLSFLTPLLSTALLLLWQGQPLQWPIAVAFALIVGGAFLGSQASKKASRQT